MGTPATEDRSRSRALAAVACVLVGLAVAGSVTSASAYWSGRGAGAGSATTAVVQPVVLSPATASAQLYPGGQAGVSLTATNPNATSLRIATLALDTGQGRGGFAVDAAHQTCDPSSLTFATQSNGGGGWTVPASGSLSLTLSGSLSMGSGADNACQGAGFTIYLKAVP